MHSSVYVRVWCECMSVWLYALASFTLYPCTKLLSWAFLWATPLGWHTPPWAILRELIVASEVTLNNHFSAKSSSIIHRRGQWHPSVTVWNSELLSEMKHCSFPSDNVLIVALLWLFSHGFPSRMPMTRRYYVHACLATHSYNGFMIFYFCHRRWSRLRPTEQNGNYAQY